MPKRAGFTALELLAMATDTLQRNRFARIDVSRAGWSLPGAALFEDEYSIVSVVVYDTWQALASEWTSAQAALVKLIGAHTSTGDAKAWEGYLVLLTPSVPTSHSGVDEIRYNVQRVRKLVATGYDLNEPADLEAVLMPLLPLPPTALIEEASALDMLPEVLSRRGVPRDVVRVIIEAFREQEPVVEKLHEWRTSR